MWRALALALGITIGIVGAETLLIDKVVLAGSTSAEEGGVLAASSASQPREITPPEWAPWTLLSAGAVIILYSFTIPRRVSS